MLRRIVVAVDGSDLSQEAFDYAIALAEPANVPILILHARERIPILAGPESRVEQELPVVAGVIESCRRMAALRNVAVEVRIVEGDLLELLADAVLETDLLAVGLKGRFRHTGIGSTTKWLLRHAPGPVMVVAGPPLRPINRLVAVFDGAEESIRAIAVATELSSRTGWPPTVLVVPGHGFDLDASLEHAQQLAPDAQVIVRAGDDGSEAARIEAAAAPLRHAMLVVGAYPDSWFHQLFLTNTTAHLLRHLHAPVIVVP